MAAPSAPKQAPRTAPQGERRGGGKKEAKVVYPSEFGSHTSMANEELTGKIAASSQDATDAWIILVDERGPFATRKSRLDTVLGDKPAFWTNRHATRSSRPYARA